MANLLKTAKDRITNPESKALIGSVEQELEERFQRDSAAAEAEAARLRKRARGHSPLAMIRHFFFLGVTAAAIIGITLIPPFVADGLKGFALLLPAIAAAVAFAYGILRGRFATAVYYTGLSGGQRSFAGIASHWRVGESATGEIRLHVYGLIWGSRWPGLSAVEVGDVHRFPVSHAVGESPVKVVFAMERPDVGLWRLPDPVAVGDGRNDPEAIAHEIMWMLKNIDDMVKSAESRSASISDEDFARKELFQRGFAPVCREAERMCMRIRKLLDDNR